LPPGLGRQLSREDVRRELEERYLMPNTSFPTSWLSKCQQFWERETDFMSLTLLNPSKPRTSIEIVITGESNLTSRNSTSLLREPGLRSDFVRGTTNQFPFAPGGLESEVLIEAVDEISKNLEESLKFDEDEILTIPPGFERGLIFEEFKELIGPIESSNSEHIQVDEQIKEQVDKDLPPAKDEMEETVDSLLPTMPPPLEGENVSSTSKSTVIAARKREWAHDVDISMGFPDFYEKYPFELDTFQKKAVYYLEIGESVFVAAHTSAGKTVVAEYAIALATKNMTRAIYTSPIKALSNQKYRDFKNTYNDDVGILTGDVQIKPEASCLIMTTEILRSMLYKGADLIRDVEFVIFDEIHYVNDTERGVVWEEVIIMLPAHVNLILLSATVPNTKEFADWIGRTKKKDIYVIKTLERPVPLEHYLYANKEIYKIVDKNRKFLVNNWKLANDSLSKKDKEKKGSASGGRGSGGKGYNRRGGQSSQMDRSQWIGLINLLKKRDLLPVVAFTFSKKKCEEYSRTLSNFDFCSSNEKSQIHVFIEKSLTQSRIRGSDRELPQIIRMRELLSRGIAVHHGGLLPIIKEMVEILFSRSLVKVLFATETFAMGVNMPARTVVFSGTRKHDGKTFRDLLPGEYTQMSGRAGRRGIDSTGMVIIACGIPTKLESQFRLTYNMILNLLRVEAIRVEEMIKRSFSENASQKMLPEKQKLYDESEKAYDKIDKLDCTICNDDINEYYDYSTKIIELNRPLLERIISHPQSRNSLSAGRIVIINHAFYGNIVGVITNSLPDKSSFWIECLPYTNISIITKSTIKLESTSVSTDPREISRVTQELLRYATETRNFGIIENEWPKIKDVDFHENWDIKVKYMDRLKRFKCRFCPDLNKHYALIHGERLLKNEIEDLKFTISGQNLELLPDYQQRIMVLKKLEYIDQNGTVQLKGRVACEINSSDELIVTELILDNVLNKYEPSEIVALLSCFVFDEKNDDNNKALENLPPKLQEGIAEIIAVAERVGSIQKDSKLDIDSEKYIQSLRFGLVNVVYEWAEGVEFKKIMELTEILEGSIVRCITRLDETCREVKSAAKMVGEQTLYKKMEDAQAKIKRGIVFATSLYL
ncbi:50_t:CDS:10, partial [Diversispora eburnea]